MTVKRRGGGPRLTADEWIILLDIFLRNGRKALSPEHPDVVQVAPLLTSLASKHGRAREGAMLRSPAGIARRLGVFRRLSLDDMRAIPAEALTIWQSMHDSPALAAKSAVDIVERENYAPAVTLEIGGAKPSRGPPPFSGSLMVERSGASTIVYAMLLEASPAERIRISSSGLPFMKFGICSDLTRREAELNQAFPPGIGLSWRRHWHCSLPDADHAYNIEQAILDALAVRGVAIGGEFCRMEPGSAVALAEDIVFKMNQELLLTLAATDANPDADSKSGER